MTGAAQRDHGGGLDAAIARYGGTRADWLDLSTGINPVPYPVGEVSGEAWTALPDEAAMKRLLTAARRFWRVPGEAEIVAAPGASALIARMPVLTDCRAPYIPGPTYNEHAAAFGAVAEDSAAPVHIYVHPNNPDGRLWPSKAIGGRPLTVVDESFCDIVPEQSHAARCGDGGVVALKSFGKFWGLAGLRLGFAIGAPDLIERLREALGPWPVSGPALEIGARALEDHAWANETRVRLAHDAERMDQLMTRAAAKIAGGTTLFRLYDVADAAAWQDRLARRKIWSRMFPYSTKWLRLGLPHPDRWDQLKAAL